MGKRAKEIQREAGKLGFTFHLNGDGSTLELLKDFYLMSLANIDFSKERHLLKKKENSNEIIVVDLCLRRSKYRTKDNPPTSLTVICFKSKELTLPEFHMLPEQIQDKLESKSDYKDIDFIEHPDFSKAYLLHGKDEISIRNLFDKSEIINFLEQEKELCIEGAGQYLIIYRCVNGDPCIVEATELDTFINKGQQIFSMFSE